METKSIARVVIEERPEEMLVEKPQNFNLLDQRSEQLAGLKKALEECQAASDFLKLPICGIRIAEALDALTVDCTIALES